ncbi:uncharacterized protein LOC119615720 [Lucilia sericata]|uniref:uncharacterized protein LOC119615720 n=1 Tax=Lucilia sericata TaxID=13632 RepID=UPI0018A82FB2|nr:uncharacterized protein LOC119615720 [Lucilia sericata]
MTSTSNTSTSNATSNDLTGSPSKDCFLFNCEHLLHFCDLFNRTEVEDQTESVLEIKLKDLETRWTNLDVSYKNVMLSQSDTVDSEFKVQAKGQYDACVSAYYHCSSQIMDLIKVSHIETPNMPVFQSTSRYSIPALALRQDITPNNSSDCIKLPPCDTEVFRGSYEEWPSFRDMFTAVYINHLKLTPVTKLYHLRNKTRGEAGDIVKRYPLSHDNFELAWNALKSRYENKRVLVDNQIKILFDIPPATNENSDSIRRIQSSVNDSLATLKTLGVAVESWDPILIRLISTKLPDLTLSLWEQTLTSPRELPKWSQMSQFLVDRYEAVERLTSIRNSKDSLSLTKSSNIQTYVLQENANSSCKLCNEEHTLRICPKFRSFSVQERIDFVFKNKYCNNCLGHSHIKVNCKSKRTCLYCKKQHHTLLHMAKKSQNTANNKEIAENVSNKPISSQNSFPKITQNDTQSEQPTTSKHIQANCSTSNENILLRTALMQIECRGELFTIRALIDPGSQRTFLTERIRNRLQLPYQNTHFEIVGIGGQKQTANKECEFTLYAKRTNIRIPIKAIVLPKVTKRLPACSFEIPNTKELENLDLADPTFNKTSQIDLILGNDYEHFINLDGIRKNICGKTSAYKTIFGWVLSGPIKVEPIQAFTTEVSSNENYELATLLKKFWEDEEIPSVNTNSKEDEYCENFYAQTTTRHKNGRYIVRLPFKTEYPKEIFLGSSRFVALAQYSRMEKTLSKDPELQSQYKAVLEEYLSLNHMEESNSQEIISQGKYLSYYLPHHAVVRPEHKTTKVRVVFNASRKTKSQVSLNDVLYAGPTLQSDLITTILNWRKYQFVFSGDIQKMYRQILIHPDDRPYQKILFQRQPDSPIKDFELKTVTFGVNCAPFLAIRTLLQLALDVESQYPKVSSILRTETYVDDILSGGYTIEETLTAQTQLIEVLNSAGFPLKKITANNPKLLTHLPKEDLYDLDFLRFHETSATKTLGIKWNALNDSFTYQFAEIDQVTKITKRQILSSIAKLFDPAGWLAPIVIRAKILLQQLWLEKLQWDEEVSQDSLQNWNTLVQDLQKVETISIPRWLQYTPSDTIQIHGFSDASKTAYCAVLYVRCQTHTHTAFSNLLVAKCKVAPIQTVCLPRLELNGALLLTKLLKYVNSTLNFKTKDIYLWTDSSIVLGWLSKPPSTWETYVANRVSQINLIAPDAIWQHVSTHDNPADLGTRGCKSHELAHNSLWWHGPSWLTNPSSAWPKRNPLNSIEKCTETQSLHIEVDRNDILDKYSSYPKALRIFCYIFRFCNQSLKKREPIENSKAPYHLTQNEMKNAKTRLIILAQKSFYPDEYNCLNNSKTISNKSPLKSLNPFLDPNSIMRVNGRLSQSSLPYSERYPIILPGNSRFCQLYLTHLHIFLCHAECSQMYRAVQTEFFIFRLKPRIKKIIRNCKCCIVFKQQPCSQIMAPLPPERCNLSLPFQITGIDFAGPFDLKTSSLRKSPYVKGYVSVFVCFSTKAIHLEPCSDLSSAAFQAAFSRFVGRRGLPQRVVTDNGRNFLGCSRALEVEFSAFVENAAHDIAQKYITHGFEWKFIPPHAPHMGGLWEAAVKSFKYHFKRVAGSHKFTYEELATVLARIEGVLNSRPISALSEDPTDLTALTPGHFLRGAPLIAFPEQSFQDMSLINRWEKLKAIHHQCSIRWKEDYLKSLHKRYKWKNSSPNIHVGDLVVVIDDLLPPHEWRLGRIEKTFPGSDNNIRAAEVRIATGTITRPIVKLCLLPFANKSEPLS